MSAAHEPPTEYFVKVPHALIRSRSVKSTPFRVYVNLLAYRGKNDYANPSIERQANDLGVSRETVTLALQDLREAGWLDYESSLGRTRTVYRFPQPPEKPVVQTVGNSGGKPPENPVTETNPTAGKSDIQPPEIPISNRRKFRRELDTGKLDSSNQIQKVSSKPEPRASATPATIASGTTTGYGNEERNDDDYRVDIGGSFVEYVTRDFDSGEETMRELVEYVDRDF